MNRRWGHPLGTTSSIAFVADILIAEEDFMGSKTLNKIKIHIPLTQNHGPLSSAGDSG